MVNNRIFSDLVDHLKKCTGKSDCHRMLEIDFIYMINLDQRPEKFLRSLNILKNYGIYPYRFSAVNGWELSLDVLNDVGLKYQPSMTSLFATTFPPDGGGEPSYEFMHEVGKTYFVHCMTRGAIGCALSHISVLKDAWDSGYETIWVMEDDIEIIKDPHIISTLINKLDALVGKENWDVLFTDRDFMGRDGRYNIAYGAAKRPDMDCSFKQRHSTKYTEDRQVSADFRKISARFGTHSMILRRAGIKKLLDFSIKHHIFLPYDLENFLAPNLNRYALTYDVVNNWIEAPSDNGSPTYQNTSENNE
jgi:GR25 family glycosyltransferase involved in LPS biosynthesis